VSISRKRTSSAPSTDRLRWLWVSLWLMAIALGAIHTWAAATSHSMNPDGISYLDIGDAYLRADWPAALSSVWSPMYSWILGTVMKFVNPPMRWEFPVVQIVNFAIYLVALVCFGFFWRQLTHFRQARVADPPGGTSVALPEWAWMSLGYTLFVVSSLHLIQIWSVTPDMLMSAFVYLAAGLVIRIRMGFTSWRAFILLGMVLGLGYLAKAVMFPLTFVFLFVTLFSMDRIREAGPRAMVALLVFLLVSLPFITVVSAAKGKLSLGGAGSLIYAHYVNHVPYPHWQGDALGNGTPEHPSRKVFEVPPIYEFGTPIGGTYPISLDPSYWYEGLVARFDLRQQIDYLLLSALFYHELFFRQQAALLVAILFLYLISHRRAFRIRHIASRWGLGVVALAAFGFYGLVCIAGRYVGVFVVLFWADMLANVALPESQTYKRLAPVLGAIMVLFMLMNILVFNLEGYRDLTGKGALNSSSSEQAGPPSWPGEVAEGLHRLGIQQGDKVAVIGYGFDSFWARLARVQIVAEMPGQEADPFWLGDPVLQSQVVRAFTSTGAQAIIAEKVPGYASLPGWHRVGDSNYYALTLLQ
jgi:hypothetical protein